MLCLIGYDRRRCLRRTRIDSIPEEPTEEDEVDNNDNQEVRVKIWLANQDVCVMIWLAI